jgi:hypothetical protein
MTDNIKLCEINKVRKGLQNAIALRQGPFLIVETSKDGKIVGYDVVVIITRPVPVDTELEWLKGYTHFEQYPADEKWGSLGWSFSNFNSARSKLLEVMKEYRGKYGTSVEFLQI